MALRLAAAARQAGLDGGLKQLFDGSGNNLNMVFRDGAVPGDVDAVSTNTVIATFAAADEGASNVNGSLADASDDGTTATIALRSSIAANAASTYDYDDAGDGEGHVELFIGTGRTAADKFGDMTVGGPGTGGTQDFDWNSDDITAGGLLTVTAFSITKT